MNDRFLLGVLMMAALGASMTGCGGESAGGDGTSDGGARDGAPADTTTNDAPPTGDGFRYVNLAFDEGSGSTLGDTGLGGVDWPDLTVNGVTTNLWSTAGSLTISPTGNRTTRVYGVAAIDDLMTLDDLGGSRYKVKFFATRLRRDVTTTPLTGNERIFQYGDQGSSASAPDGGWVARINFGTTAPFLTNTLSFAIHTPYPGFTKPGGQGSPNFPDPIYTTRAFTDAELTAGLSLVFGVDNSVTPYRVIVFIDGAQAGADPQANSTVTYPLPGRSTNGPGTDASSNGFVLFAQSTNQDTALLKSAVVSPIWIGEARDAQHLATIAQRLHADPAALPY